MQLLSTAPGTHQAPPPDRASIEDVAGYARVAPPVNVNPDNALSELSQAQRTALSPIGRRPLMIVDFGPFTLFTCTAFVTAMRFIVESDMTLPPVSYTPLVTRTVSPLDAASMAGCTSRAAAAQFVYGGMAAP